MIFVKKVFINTVRLKLLKKEEQIKNKLSMEKLNRIAYGFATDRLTTFTIEKLIKFCSRKSKLSVYQTFSRLVIFHEMLHDCFTFTDISFTVYSGRSLV